MTHFQVKYKLYYWSLTQYIYMRIPHQLNIITCFFMASLCHCHRNSPVLSLYSQPCELWSLCRLPGPMTPCPGTWVNLHSWLVWQAIQCDVWLDVWEWELHATAGLLLAYCASSSTVAWLIYNPPCGCLEPGPSSQHILKMQWESAWYTVYFYVYTAGSPEERKVILVREGWSHLELSG